MKNGLWVVLAIPLQLSQWVPTQMGSQNIPKFEKTPQKEWKISGSQSAGGYGFFLEKPWEGVPESLVLRWRWRVLLFPKTEPRFPLMRALDDYPLRVGVLINDGRSKMRLPGPLGKKIKERGIQISHVVFYGAVRRSGTETDPQCGRSPYKDEVLICHRVAGVESRDEEAYPILDLKRHFDVYKKKNKPIQIVGFWVFADSDNSSSASMAYLSRLELVRR